MPFPLAITPPTAPNLSQNPSLWVGEGIAWQTPSTASAAQLHVYGAQLIAEDTRGLTLNPGDNR